MPIVMKDRLIDIAAPVVVAILFLGGWEWIVRANAIPPYILPGPLLVAQTLWSDGPSLLQSLMSGLRQLCCRRIAWRAAHRRPLSHPLSLLGTRLPVSLS